MSFQLHPQLAKDCHYLGDFPLTALLLSKDANYPWYILVPRQENISEAFQLSEEHQQQLNKESLLLSKILNELYSADKMNIAALGNMVPQLHLHHIVRYKTDVAWPNPVWGYAEALAYNERALTERISNTLKALINGDFIAHS
ncbi:MAG: HIT domain-containing protein [Cycloclasticus sp.]|nr:hypothetical protein A9Q82_00185 [Cycloclasticus sp. 46_120_T64]